jgi:putative phosphoesterase
MRIALISDTHGSLPQQTLNCIQGSDLIIHAGDIGSPSILDELELIAPVRAVLGNNDWPKMFPELNYTWQGQLEGLNIFLAHMPSDIQRYLKDCQKSAVDGSKTDKLTLPNICIHGHTHVPRNERINGVHFINPGAISRPRNGSAKSLAILDVEAGSVRSLKFIDV